MEQFHRHKIRELSENLSQFRQAVEVVAVSMETDTDVPKSGLLCSATKVHYNYNVLFQLLITFKTDCYRKGADQTLFVLFLCVLTTWGSVEDSIKSLQYLHVMMWISMRLITHSYEYLPPFLTNQKPLNHIHCWTLYIIITVRVLLHMCKPAHFRFTCNNKQGYLHGKYELFTLWIPSLLTHRNCTVW